MRVRLRRLCLLVTALGLAYPADAAEHVILISVDGLRPDIIDSLGAAQLPNFARLRREGAWTHDARTDVDHTFTSPNHVSMVTGRPVNGVSGHNYTNNGTVTLTLHQTKGAYVASMFDVAHDHGRKTAVYRSKDKLEIFTKSYDAANGAVDRTGVDNGRDKIDSDVFVGDGMARDVVARFVAEMPVQRFHLTLLHLVDPDTVGHGDNWLTPTYASAVRVTDGFVGQVLNMIAATPALAGRTAIVLTADHGGTGSAHSDQANVLNYRIPFYVWGPDVTRGGDLYEFSLLTRLHPGATRPAYSAAVQPIRNGDAGNLALKLLGLPAVPDAGAVINRNQDLAFNPLFLKVTPQLSSTGAITVSWENLGPSVVYTVETTADVAAPVWQPAAGQTWPISETSWTDTAPGARQKFYRVKVTRSVPAPARSPARRAVRSTRK